MEHQIHNSIGGVDFNAFLYKNYCWKTHFHRRYEMTFVTKGKLSVELDDEKYEVLPGEAILVMPFIFHSLTTEPETEYLTVVFDESYVKTFCKSTAQKVPLSAIFKPDELTAKIIYEFLGGGGKSALGHYEDKYMLPVENNDIMRIKAGLYAFCSKAYSTITWIKRSRDDKMTYSIISFIAENFATDISLASMAESLGYDYGYLSRVFNELFSINFRTLLNQFRCDHAYNLITSGADTLTEIALKSGFQSIRSFNRVFKEIIGIAPSELRRRER